ncbi:uncharacterized protein NPIL_611171 [Nephila pilipes]|uniref:Uncharacterized protein n=1 Tax=Nephila pilipes TaxID=299642 RepID=A0A8X6UFU7_NEPPI|nr:uncharacterized protein NPIL_611171 [Nephila pilipes]
MALRNVPVLSLRQMAMIKVAIHVCNDPDIQDFVKENGSFSFVFPSDTTQIFLNGAKLKSIQTWAWENCFTEASSNSWIESQVPNYDRLPHWDMRTSFPPFKTWTELVEKKVSSFLLPRKLHPELLDVIRLVSLEIDKWTKEHSLILKKFTEFTRAAQCYFQWNSRGIIDRIKTARTLIRNASLPFEERNILALHYGLMDDLLAYRSKGLTCGKIVDMLLPTMMRGAGEIWEPFTGESDFNYIAQRNFFNKSTPEQKLECLKTVLSQGCMLYENFLFCLSQMGDDQREVIFKEYALKILMYFMDWPFQCQFLDAARQLLPYFKRTDFQRVLYVILYERIMIGWKDFEYISLLKEFWSQSPTILKQQMETNSIYENLKFTLNYSGSNNFPREIVFDYDNLTRWAFGFRGIRYFLFIKQKSYRGMFVDNLFDFTVNDGYQFGSIFYVFPFRRINSEKGIQTQIKQWKNDFISTLGGLFQRRHRST